jgi:hypothetical protein
LTTHDAGGIGNLDILCTGIDYVFAKNTTSPQPLPDTQYPNLALKKVGDGVGSGTGNGGGSGIGDGFISGGGDGAGSGVDGPGFGLGAGYISKRVIGFTNCRILCMGGEYLSIRFLLRVSWRLKPQLHNQSPPTRTDS